MGNTEKKTTHGPSRKTYNEIRPYIDVGDFLQFVGRGLISWGIQWRSAGFKNIGKVASHTAPLMTIHGRVFNFEALNDGPRLYHTSKRIRDYDGKVYWRRLRPQYDAYRYRIRDELLDYAGVEYDWWKIAKNLFKRTPLGGSRAICSELMAAALVESHLLDIDFVPRPYDLDIMPKINQLYYRGVEVYYG